MSYSRVAAPKELVAKGLQERCLRALQDKDLIGSLADGEPDVILARLASPVDSHKEVVAAALDAQLYCDVIGKHQGADSKSMRRNRNKPDVLTAGQHDGTAHTQSIACAACRGIDDKTIGLIGREVFAIEVNANAYHAAVVAFQHSHFVESERIALHLALRAFHLQGAATLRTQPSAEELIERHRDVVEGKVCKEA